MRFTHTIVLSIPLLLLACGSDDTSPAPVPPSEQDAGHDSASPTDASQDSTTPTDASQDSTTPTDASQDSTPDQGEPDTGPEEDVGTGDADQDSGEPPETGAETGPDASVADQALQSYAQSFCALIDRCSPFMLGYLYGHEADCVARYLTGGRRAVLPQATGVNRTADDVLACAGAMDTMTCEELYAGARETACPVIPGALPEGGDCFTNLQCATGFCHRVGTCGTCAPRIGAGGACEQSNDGCDVDLVCYSPAISEPTTCTPTVAEGQSCGAGVVCRGNLTCRAGTCRQPGALGDPCDTSPNSCNGMQTLRCSGGTCVAGAAFAQEGQPCGLQGSSYVWCLGTSVCDASTKRCQAKIVDGEACESGIPNRCLYYASCKNDVCTVDSESTCP